MWPFKKKEPVIINRSRTSGEDLTKDEVSWMEFHMRTGFVFCPDCQKNRLLAGPEGGCAINCLCPHCGSEFNLTAYDNGSVKKLFAPERISDAGPRDFKDRAFLYKGPIKV